MPRTIRSAVHCPNQLGVVPIHSFSFPLIALALQLHRERNDVVVHFAVIVGPDDFFPAHGTLGDAFAGLGTLVFAGYQGFHETCVAEKVTLKRRENFLVVIGEKLCM